MANEKIKTEAQTEPAELKESELTEEAELNTEAEAVDPILEEAPEEKSEGAVEMGGELFRRLQILKSSSCMPRIYR